MSHCGRCALHNPEPTFGHVSEIIYIPIIYHVCDNIIHNIFVFKRIHENRFWFLNVDFG